MSDIFTIAGQMKAQVEQAHDRHSIRGMRWLVSESIMKDICSLCPVEVADVRDVIFSGLPVSVSEFATGRMIALVDRDGEILYGQNIS